MPHIAQNFLLFRSFGSKKMSWEKISDRFFFGGKTTFPSAKKSIIYLCVKRKEKQAIFGPGEDANARLNRKIVFYNGKYTFEKTKERNVPNIFLVF